MHKSKNKEQVNRRKELKTKQNNEMVGVKSNHISNYLNASDSDSN